jgi:hypothetical protein
MAMTIRRNPTVWLRLARCAATLTLIVFCALAAGAQTAPYALFQYSTLTATQNTITVTQLPVVTSSGKTVYWNITVQFDVANNGSLTLAAGSPQIVPAPPATVNGFQPGIYLGPDDSAELISVTGPATTQGGATEWALSPATGASGCLEPGSASWFDGTLSSTTDPTLYTRVTNAGISPSGNSLFFGIGTQVNATKSSCGQSAWDTNALLGFSQTGSQLVIYSFTDFNGGDHNTAQAQKVYCLVGSSGCGPN